MSGYGHIAIPTMRWGLTDTGGVVLADPRAGMNRRHLLVGLLRQSLFGRLADERFVFSRAKKWQRTRSR
jgi:hypothetical protein